MQTTGNLGLKKPEGTDIVDIADLNGNMDILDTTVNNKVDKVTGKQLSTNDYTAAEKTKLAGIATGANNYAHPNHTGDVTSNGDGVTAIAPGVIVDADVSASAAIAWSKLNKTGASLADLPTRSAADLNSGTLPAARLPAISGDITMAAGTSSAAITAGVIVNADVNANAAIAFSKINSADSIMDSDISSEAYINMKKIGAGLVDNTKLGYLSGVTSDIQTQLNNKASLVTTPQQTTADLTYYVRTDGNDNNTGLANTAAGAFKTITKAISFIPQIVNHAVTVNVAAGTYSEIISLSGFSGGGSITIQGDTVASSSRTVQAIAIINNSTRTALNGLNCNASNTNGVSISKSVYVEISYCNLIASAPTASGVDASASTVRVKGCAISNKGQAILSADGSRIHSDSNSGSGNTYALYVYQGAGLITQSGTQPSSTNGNGAATGLVLSSGVLNPWGDNTLTSRSAGRASMSATQTLGAASFTKLAFNALHQDYSNEFNTSLNRFIVKKSGWYLITGGVGISSAPVGTTVNLMVYINGARDLDIGSFSPSGAVGGLSVYGSGSLYIPAGSYVELYAYSTSSVVTHAGSHLTSFTLTQLA